MLLDLLSQIEPDDSWRPQLPDLKHPPYPLAVYTLASAPLPMADLGGGVGPSGMLRAGTVRQYMAAVGPLFVESTQPVITPEWVPQPPPVILPQRRSDGWNAFIDNRPSIRLEWLPALPSINVRAGTPQGWFAFVPQVAATPFPDRSWAPTFPDQLTQPLARAASRPGTFSLVVDTVTGHGPGSSGLLWTGRVRRSQGVAAPLFVETHVTVTPEWIPNLPPLLQPSRRSDGWYAFVPAPSETTLDWAAGWPTPTPLPARRADGWNAFVDLQPDSPALAWQPTYPNQLLLLRLPTGAFQFFAYDPFPRPPAGQLSAWPVYPDRLNRVTLPPALMPFFFYGSWVPIPNPPVTLILEDRVLIGQSQSIETPFYPSIGGSTTWS